VVWQRLAVASSRHLKDHKQGGQGGRAGDEGFGRQQLHPACGIVSLFSSVPVGSGACCFLSASQSVHWRSSRLPCSERRRGGQATEDPSLSAWRLVSLQNRSLQSRGRLLQEQLQLLVRGERSSRGEERGGAGRQQHMPVYLTAHCRWHRGLLAITIAAAEPCWRPVGAAARHTCMMQGVLAAAAQQQPCHLTSQCTHRLCTKVISSITKEVGRGGQQTEASTSVS
jgi:hypothetical protein